MGEKEEIKKLLKRFGSHRVLISKYIFNHPMVAEREYVRLSRKILLYLKTEIEKELPGFKKKYRAAFLDERKKNSILPSETTPGKNQQIVPAALFTALTNVFTTIDANVTAKIADTGLAKKIEKLSRLTQMQTAKEWAISVKNTLGVDIREDYYAGDFYKQQMDIWVKENVELIKSVPHDAIKRMNEAVYKGFANGKTATEISQIIQDEYGMSKRHAAFIARDQIAKLNGEIQRAQQIDAGVDEYIWTTVGDSRVRESHAALNGKRCRWDAPPENEDGRACHPGEDYGCRCIGRPVFDKDKLKLPLKDDVIGIKGEAK